MKNNSLDKIAEKITTKFIELDIIKYNNFTEKYYIDTMLFSLICRAIKSRKLMEFKHI